MESFEDREFPAVTELSKRQRRVLGVLVEKAFTTPEYYPLTLKAATTGCNQKSNRDPVSRYSEDEVEETLDELREMGLVSVVHTDSGRAERYRHWMRKRFQLSEPQLAIQTELWLRGRQSLGELRARSSRMVPIESLDQLRIELAGLLEMKLIQANGSLNKRGVEVDHAMYLEKEGMTIPPQADEAIAQSSPHVEMQRPSAPSSTHATPDSARIEAIEQTCAELRKQNRELTEELSVLREEMQQMEQNLERLRTELGG